MDFNYASMIVCGRNTNNMAVAEAAAKNFCQSDGKSIKSGASMTTHGRQREKLSVKVRWGENRKCNYFLFSPRHTAQSTLEGKKGKY